MIGDRQIKKNSISLESLCELFLLLKCTFQFMFENMICVCENFIKFCGVFVFTGKRNRITGDHQSGRTRIFLVLDRSEKSISHLTRFTIIFLYFITEFIYYHFVCVYFILFIYFLSGLRSDWHVDDTRHQDGKIRPSP